MRCGLATVATDRTDGDVMNPGDRFFPSSTLRMMAALVLCVGVRETMSGKAGAG